MKTRLPIGLMLLLMGCTLHREVSSSASSAGDDSRRDAASPDAADSAAAPLARDPASLGADAGAQVDAATGLPPDVPVIPLPDAGLPDAALELDSGSDAATKDPDAAVDAGSAIDASTVEAGEGPTVDAGPPHTGAVRSLHVHLTGMDDDLRRFSQFRVVTPALEFFVMFVIHEGIPTADYDFELPNALFVGQSYTLNFFIDHDGSGGYNPPPIDHAWSIPIPAGDGDVFLEFPHDESFTDIEQTAPSMVRSLILSSSNMYTYVNELFDVRVIDRATGRLCGRQVREVPGDAFDLTVGAVVHPGVEYQVDISVDRDADGAYTPGMDLGWRIVSTATDTGLHLPFAPDAEPVDLSQ